MKKYPDFWHVLIGNGPVGALLAFIVLAFICAFISILWGIGNRDVNSPNTPMRFSLRFYFAANAFRMTANFLLIPIFIRLTYEYVDPKWMLLVSLGLGFGVDQLGAIAKKYGIFTTSKLASRIADQIAATDSKTDSSPKN